MIRIAPIVKMPGLIAPAFFLALAMPVTAQQQQQQRAAVQPRPSVQPPPSIRPTPSQLELSKMIWSTIAAVDHANRSGNYSVLRDISAQGFQINNNAAQLAQVFAGIRNLQLDLGNALLSGGLHHRHRQRLVRWARPAADARILDLACGTGDLSLLLCRARPQGVVVGVDVSADMIDLARDKARAGDRVRYVRSDAASLPFAAGSFDLVTCGFAGRWFDWDPVLDEIWRVLRPGGSFWNVDFGRPPSRTLDRGYRAALEGAGQLVGRALTGDPAPYLAIADTVAAYPGQRWLRDRMRAHGFDAFVRDRQLGALAYNAGRKRRR